MKIQSDRKKGNYCNKKKVIIFICFNICHYNIHKDFKVETIETSWYKVLFVNLNTTRTRYTLHNKAAHETHYTIGRLEARFTTSTRDTLHNRAAGGTIYHANTRHITQYGGWRDDLPREHETHCTTERLEAHFLVYFYRICQISFYQPDHLTCPLWTFSGDLFGKSIQSCGNFCWRTRFGKSSPPPCK